jgi:hypothetical protein
MVYIGCDKSVPLSDGEVISVKPLSEDDGIVRQCFTKRNVYFIGSHTGCSCGFPSASGAEPIEYYDGFFDDERTDRPKDLESMTALIGLLRELTASGTTVEVLPAWWDNRGKEPRGRLRLDVTRWDPSKAFFNEDYLYEMVAEPTSAGDAATRAAPEK